jgi:cytochrome c oxidase subunit 4
VTLPATIGVWLVLMLLLGIEFSVGGAAAMAIGGAMAVIVALTYMRLTRSKDVSSAFALAAVFWLMVLLGLGSMDSATRHDISVSAHTER